LPWPRAMPLKKIIKKRKRLFMQSDNAKNVTFIRHQKPGRGFYAFARLIGWLVGQSTSRQEPYPSVLSVQPTLAHCITKLRKFTKL